MKKWMYICMAALTITAAVSGCSGNGGAEQETEASGAPQETQKEASQAQESAGSETEAPDEVTAESALEESEAAQELVSGRDHVVINMEDYEPITVEIYADEAPITATNFLKLAEEGFYDGLTFHRIIDDFMVQGGDPEGTGAGGESIWGEYFEDEFSETLYPLRGALCMANRGSDTNGSQFFIVQADASTIQDLEEQLAAYDMTLQDYIEQVSGVEVSDEAIELYEELGGTPWLHMAHTVFGQVYAGYDVLDEVAAVPADAETGVPEEEVVIETITIFTYGE